MRPHRQLGTKRDEVRTKRDEAGRSGEQAAPSSACGTVGNRTGPKPDKTDKTDKTDNGPDTQPDNDNGRRARARPHAQPWQRAPDMCCAVRCVAYAWRGVAQLCGRMRRARRLHESTKSYTSPRVHESTKSYSQPDRSAPELRAELGNGARMEFATM